MVIDQRHKEKQTITLIGLVRVKMYAHTTRLALTFADLHALKPAVINVSVANTSTVLKPSTARSATTDFAGFLERAALWARHRISTC